MYVLLIACCCKPALLQVTVIASALCLVFANSSATMPALVVAVFVNGLPCKRIMPVMITVPANKTITKEILFMAVGSAMKIEFQAANCNTRKREKLRYIKKLNSFVTLLNKVPVHHIPPCIDVIGSFVLIFEIVSMFPNIQAKKRSSFNIADIH